MRTSTSPSTLFCIAYSMPSLARTLLVWGNSHFKSCRLLSYAWTSPRRCGLFSANHDAFVYHFYTVDVFLLVSFPDRSAVFHFESCQRLVGPSLSTWGHWRMVRHRALVVLFAELMTFLMWWSQFRVELMFTPRYVLQSVRSSEVPQVASVGYLLRLLLLGDHHYVTFGYPSARSCSTGVIWCY